MYLRVTVFVSWQMQNYSVKINTELLEDERMCVSDRDIGETANEFVAFNT
jgi:hypothetical protein